MSTQYLSVFNQKRQALASGHPIGSGMPPTPVSRVTVRRAIEELSFGDSLYEALRNHDDVLELRTSSRGNAPYDTTSGGSPA